VELTAAEIADAVDGALRGRADAAADSFSIDTRQLEPGACFVALTAARDGHDFVPDAWDRGATVALVGRDVATPSDRASVRAGDPLVGLRALGTMARDRLPHATVVGVTGSAGKTATKDLLTAALASTRTVHSSPASFNNEAGVPLTLLGASLDADVVVAEMGARFAGNIAALCKIARPDIGIVTNIGLAHAGLLGGPEGIARAKGELLEALPAHGLAVFEAGTAVTGQLRSSTHARVLTVGTDGAQGADIRAGRVRLDDDLRPHFELETPWGRASVHLALRGEHQVMNAAMAAAVAGDLGVPLDELVAGLGRAVAAPGRMQLMRGSGGVVVLNDAYNASPPSTAAALRALDRLPVGGRRVAVLGEMRELGEHAGAEHEDIGRLAAECRVQVLILVGEGARPVAGGAAQAGNAIEIVAVPDADAARVAACDRVRAGDAVLVKASRAVGLEVVAEALAGATFDA
jgi:UDP-N-acetylmuramoyl-tripeptide--D-alanyl-D-alanine ligase